MKKFLMALAMLFCVQQAQAGSPFDSPAAFDAYLRTRTGMVVSVGLLLSVPPKCMVDKRVPSTENIMRYALAYGHNIDDQFLNEVKAYNKERDASFVKLSNDDKTAIAEMVCATVVLISAKVKEAR